MTALSIQNHSLHADGVPIAELPRLPGPATVRVWSVPKEYRPSGYFIDTQPDGGVQGVPACASNDAHYIGEVTLDADDEAMASRARDELLDQANHQADVMLSQLDATYPDREVLTWDQQVKEAEALQADPGASAPLLESLAQFRDIEIGELADKVLTKSMLYKVASGQIMGARQWVENQLEAAQTHEDVINVPGIAERYEFMRAP